MKKSLRQFKVSITIFLCFSFLIFGIMPFSSMKVNATTVSYNTPAFSSLIPHDPIYITSDLDFVFFPGAGVIGAPYVIEGYNITTTEDYGISITGTNSLFVIRNCYIEAKYGGIYIKNSGLYVPYGTANIINNTCNNNLGFGIWIWESDGSTVINNTCKNNYRDGIALWDSESSIVTNNTCISNNRNGICLTNSESSIVSSNACNYNNKTGIELGASHSSTLSNNTCISNNEYGLYLAVSNFCVVNYNLLQENEEYGISLETDISTDNSLIHHNKFVDNNIGGTSQGLDSGLNNQWYEQFLLQGNYWSDWSGTGSYSIDGSSNSFDPYPSEYPPTPPIIESVTHYPSNPTEFDTIRVNATVADDSSVHTVNLHHRINGGTWTEVSMTLISGDIYSVTFGPFAANDIIEYYVTATDNSANHNEATEDNSGSYYSFTVSVVILEFQIYSPSLLSVITFLFLFCGLLVQQRRKK